MKKKRRDPHLDSEDMFADTRMTLGGHIEDLRSHLLRAIYGFCIGMVLSLTIGKPVLNFIAKPVEDQLMEYWTRYYNAKQKEFENSPDGVFEGKKIHFPRYKLDVDELVKHLPWEVKGNHQAREAEGLNPAPAFASMFAKLGVGDAPLKRGIMYLEPDRREMIKFWGDMNLEMRPPTLRTFSITEAFVVYLKVSMLAGLVLSSPWVFYQIWSFIAAGLFPHEKRLVNVYLPYSLGLFLIGVFVCELFVIPKAVGALLWFNEWLGLEPDLRLNEWLSFAILMPVVFGVSFQTPLVMLFTEKIGLFDVPTFRSYRRAAYFIIFAIAMIIIPAMDAVSMLLLAVPMCLLYEFGILLCIWQPRSEFDDVDSDESQELIEA